MTKKTKIRNLLRRRNVIWVNHMPLGKKEVCLVTAIQRCYGHRRYRKIAARIVKYLGLMPVGGPLSEWNDRQDTIENVLAVVDALDI